MSSAAASVQGRMTVGRWLSNARGSFGVDAQYSKDAKDLISSDTIQSHVTMYCIGMIPSIVSNEIEMGVKQFSEDDGHKGLGDSERHDWLSTA